MKMLLALAAVLLATTSCSGSDDEPPTPATATPTADPFAVSCPPVDSGKQDVVAFRAVDRAAPRLRAELTINDLGRRRFCVGADSYETPGLAARIVSYTVELDQRDNYGERYSTFDRDGSDELLNFPFYFQVYGPCRGLTATIAVRSDGTEQTYRVATRVGPKCAD